jgi:replicative DNA helicase
MDRYPDEELWQNVVAIVFSPHWKGGTYSYENTPLLQVVGQRLGLPKDKAEDNVLVPVENMTSTFKRFATEIDKNTIKLGIDPIDARIRVTTSMAVGLLAGPGAGKTSLSLGILNHNSLANIPSLFFSLDMGAPLVYQRLIQKHLGYSDKKIFDIYQKNDTKSMELIEKTISTNYKNVKFCFRSGLNIEDIRNTITQYQDTTGEKIKLVVIDYLETISGPYSDATANSGYIAQAIKDIANDLEITVLVLLQPQKGAGDPSEELMSYRQIKGSSQIEQALSVIFTLWRPGFNPVSPEDDKYASIAVVKNRMGSLAKFDFMWNGMTGDLAELDEYEKQELKELIDRRLKEKLAKDLI